MWVSQRGVSLLPVDGYVLQPTGSEEHRELRTNLRLSWPIAHQRPSAVAIVKVMVTTVKRPMSLHYVQIIGMTVSPQHRLVPGHLCSKFNVCWSGHPGALFPLSPT